MESIYTIADGSRRAPAPTRAEPTPVPEPARELVARLDAGDKTVRVFVRDGVVYISGPPAQFEWAQANDKFGRPLHMPVPDLVEVGISARDDDLTTGYGRMAGKRVRLWYFKYLPKGE